MELLTKNRQFQTAELCKQHLRDKYKDKLSLVEGFIQETEGTGKQQYIASWGQFTDIKGMNNEMLTRVDLAFDDWFNPAS